MNTELVVLWALVIATAGLALIIWASLRHAGLVRSWRPALLFVLGLVFVTSTGYTVNALALANHL